MRSHPLYQLDRDLLGERAATGLDNENIYRQTDGTNQDALDIISSRFDNTCTWFSRI